MFILYSFLEFFHKFCFQIFFGNFCLGNLFWDIFSTKKIGIFQNFYLESYSEFFPAVFTPADP